VADRLGIRPTTVQNHVALADSLLSERYGSDIATLINADRILIRGGSNHQHAPLSNGAILDLSP
jgi:hypothetical protein